MTQSHQYPPAYQMRKISLQGQKIRIADLTHEQSIVELAGCLRTLYSMVYVVSELTHIKEEGIPPISSLVNGYKYLYETAYQTLYEIKKTERLIGDALLENIDREAADSIFFSDEMTSVRDQLRQSYGYLFHFITTITDHNSPLAQFCKTTSDTKQAELQTLYHSTFGNESLPSDVFKQINSPNYPKLLLPIDTTECKLPLAPTRNIPLNLLAILYSRFYIIFHGKNTTHWHMANHMGRLVTAYEYLYQHAYCDENDTKDKRMGRRTTHSVRQQLDQLQRNFRNRHSALIDKDSITWARSQLQTLFPSFVEIIHNIQQEKHAQTLHFCRIFVDFNSPPEKPKQLLLAVDQIQEKTLASLSFFGLQTFTSELNRAYQEISSAETPINFFKRFFPAASPELKPSLATTPAVPPPPTPQEEQILPEKKATQQTPLTQPLANPTPPEPPTSNTEKEEKKPLKNLKPSNRFKCIFSLFCTPDEPFLPFPQKDITSHVVLDKNENENENNWQGVGTRETILQIIQDEKYWKSKTIRGESLPTGVKAMQDALPKYSSNKDNVGDDFKAIKPLAAARQYHYWSYHLTFRSSKTQSLYDIVTSDQKENFHENKKFQKLYTDWIQHAKQRR